MEEELLILKDRLVESKRKMLNSYYDMICWFENNYKANLPDEYRKQVKKSAHECFLLLKHEKALYTEWKFMNILLKYIEVSGRFSKGIDEDASSDMYNYMYRNGIGTTHAEFFISWAKAVEVAGFVPAATIIYNRGLEVSAFPRESLEREKSLFQERVAGRTLTRQIRQGVATLPSERSDNETVKALQPVPLLMFNERALSQNGKEISFEEWRALHLAVSPSDVSDISASFQNVYSPTEKRDGKRCGSLSQDKYLKNPGENENEQVPKCQYNPGTSNMPQFF